MTRLLLLYAALSLASSQVLTPSQITISLNKPVAASATCGEVNGQPINEVYCSLTGSSQYTPLNQYSYSDSQTTTPQLQELRNPRELFVQGGHGCGHCMANSVNAHPASFMVDGNTSWWQSPPLSRGLQYDHINITIDLEQEFHVAYVWIQMANSPRPGTWVLERSVDHGESWMPWFYFAENNAECMRRFGPETLAPLTEDEQTICRTDMASIQPLENAEMVINLLENRPSRLSFSTSASLQNFTRATNVRIRLLGTRTLQGHLLDLTRKNDPTVTRRYFYSIKEIHMGGRCVCNGHASTCDILDYRRPRTLLCRCEHNTCGDMCERCCPGFEQKNWQKTTATNNFTCEPCNCFGRSNDCVYDEELDKQSLSLDIHGNYEGGGRCLNCRDNTEGINCNQCKFGFFRPEGINWNDTNPCQTCMCDPSKHTGGCAEGTGKCECQPRFEGEECDKCAPGYYDPPECKTCECSVIGTLDGVCLPSDGQCPCKDGFGGLFCDTCAPGFTNMTAGCEACKCNEVGSLHSNCSAETGQCECKAEFSGLGCDECSPGYFNFPTCTYCNCDPSGTEGGNICDPSSGQCLCKPGFAGDRCDQCDTAFYGYPACKSCDCVGAGAKSPECDIKTGECPCNSNFTGRACDKCAAGFYDYPKCRACECLLEGAKGQTCDSNGQCYCKGNFEGERCDRCKPDFYNFPVCEECNCHPSGVTPNFGGCDKVAPGELCSCREHVSGRICDKCKPTFWDLQYHHPDGCISCDCNLAGTLSMLNSCDEKNGQCTCKRHVGGRGCDQCAEGFYNMKSFNQLGCEPCNCDLGGALKSECNGKTGQCKCRPRVTGKKCDKPIDNHFFPTLWHNMYEAEDGRTVENRPVRFANDEKQFPGFSWRGYAVFSPIQEKIILDADIAKSSVYRILLRYHNPTDVPITAVVAMAPAWTNTQDIEQSEKITLPPTTTPQMMEVTMAGKPFVLNPGKWALTVATKQRLFLDYVVILPQEYYEGTILKERVPSPCRALTQHNTTCLDLLYPPIDVAAARADASGAMPFKEVADDGTEKDLEPVPIEVLPAIIGPAAFVRADNKSRMIKATLNVPENDDYVVLLEYHNNEETDLPLQVQLIQNNITKLDGTAIIQHCPYAVFCRELVTAGGRVPEVRLEKGTAELQFSVDPMHEFGLAAVSIIPKSKWNNDFLQQYPVCTRKDGKCVSQQYPPAQNSVTAEAEEGANADRALTGDKLPFPIANPEHVTVMPLDEAEQIEISGVVPQRGHYKFIVNYFNPDNTPINVNVLLQNQDQFYQDGLPIETSPTMAVLPLEYCPSVSGCRALIHEKDRSSMNQFWMEDRYTLQFSHNATNKPIYIDSVTAVPYHDYNAELMNLQPIDLSNEFVDQCSENYLENPACNVTEFCRDKIFTLTADFNQAAFSCDCVAAGSTSFACEAYGGQCQCKPNVIGRRCERCAPGHYDFPNCLKCKCGANQQCDDQTGQCFCAPHVEGQQCDKCVSYAFGYDPLIGCQLCGCNPQGSDNGALQCDPLSGQCLCKEAVGGRQCDRCLAGSYGFPHCYECRCNTDGTTEEICDATSAQCSCKENVYGQSCEHCKPGTFDLSPLHPDGCIECFCFGITDRCRSSFYPVAMLAFNISGFSSTDLNGKVEVKDDVVTYTAGPDGAPKDVYFNIPIPSERDYTTSYGLTINFKLASTPAEGSKGMSSEPDLRLIGRNMTAEYWATEQPADPSQPFSVELKLVPENFVLSNGKPMTRNDMMMLLYNLENITLKGSYFNNPQSVDLIEFGLGISGEQYGGDNLLRASSVEHCDCPAPYTGPSCQECAIGYYRVRTGPYLGSCVPCECSGHSGTCDPETGICSNCEHNTHGEHCELCDEGFYGDASLGSPYACTACNCPFAPTNNFASSCEASPLGEVLSCNCKTGYTGPTCDRCDSGYFGEPMSPGGSCSPCHCNDNNNLTDPRSCHPITGDCYQCEKNTDGRHCEWCTHWYYGDAVEEKNCKECSCDQCGAHDCDNKNGTCNCKQNVVGDQCERCAPDHFGYSKCQGCLGCHCGIASSSSQCHDETGQCACRPGAAGLRCERCENGYWAYGANGCQKCDCEADLSMGTVCDVRTGQCHCQEGATGPRCDQCQPSYLRIPTFGCRRCDECVHSLKGDVDNLGLSIDSLDSSISNISAATVAGARLSRSNKTLSNIQEVAELINNFQNEDHDSFFGVAKSVLSNVTSLANSAKRTGQVLVDDNDRVANLTKKTEDILSDIRDRAEVATWVVDDMKNLANSIGSESAALNIRPEWVEEANLILEQIKNVSSEKPAALLDTEISVEGVKKNLAELSNKTEVMKNRLSAAMQNVSDIEDFINAAKHQLMNNQKMSKDTKQKAKNLSLFHVEALGTGITSDSEKAREEINQVENTTQEVNSALEQLKESFTKIEEGLQRVNESRGALAELSTPRRFKRDSPVDEVMYEMRSRSNELRTQADQLNGTFGNARLASHNAVTAANAHEDVTNALQNARKTAEEASEALSGEKEGVQELNENVAAKETESKELDKKAGGLSEDLEKLSKETAETERTTKAVKETIGSIVSRKDALVETMKEPGFNKSLVEEVAAQVAKLEEKTKDLMDSVNTDKEEIKKNAANADLAIKDSTKAKQGVKQLMKNIDTLAELVPKVGNRYTSAQDTIGNKTARVESILEKVEALKEKVARARDAANRIRLGAHFEKGSSIDLPIPHAVSHSAAYTDLSLSFRTPEAHGIPIFFGNEEGSAGTRAVPTDDYIAVEIQHGKPRVSVNLGNGPLTVELDTDVSDNRWRKVFVERIGKAATISLTHPNSDDIAESKTAVAKGNKSVLNLHQKLSKLFVGGIPRNSRITREIHSRDFVGDIQDLELHGVPVGLWNTKQNGMVQVRGAQAKPTGTDKTYQTGVSLDGEGYIIYKMKTWNPRQKTHFRMSFLSYSPDGLLFYIGLEKDFLSLELAHGTVQLSLDLGNGVGKFQSDKTCNDGQWHTVSVQRMEKHIVLEVDGEEVATGDAPGTMTELSISDYFYVGGVPPEISIRSTVEPLKGCVKEVQLESEMVDLQVAHASKGVRNACTASKVRTISILSERSGAYFPNVSLSDVLEVTLKFKSREATGTLFSITTEFEEPILTVAFKNGMLSASINNKETVEMELASVSDGQWHYISVSRDKAVLRVDADDLYNKEVPRTSAEAELVRGPDERVRIVFGKQPLGSFLGCVGDVTYNGKVMDFARSEANEVQLTGCALPADVIIPTVSSVSTTVIPSTVSSEEMVESTESAEVLVSEATSIETTAVVEEPTTTEEPTTEIPSTTEKPKNVRTPGSCMLPRVPIGSRDDSDGARYGLQIGSRLEFENPPDTFDKSGTFSVQLRATASNGVILFATDRKDHLGIFLVDGKVVFSFNTGSGAVSISANTSVLDDDWHTVKAYRNGNGGTLQVDEELVEVAAGDKDSTGTDSVDTQPPLYLGGIPSELATFMRGIVPGIKTEFSGCLRDLKLNDKKFDGPSKNVGTGQCSEFSESGMYFGEAGGYAILHKEFQVGATFSAELEIRPRVNNGILFSVGVLEYLTVQLKDGQVKFTIEAGNGPESLVSAVLTNTTLCDGHWHTIKVNKKKRLMTLTVDGKSSLNVMKKGKKEGAVTNDPIYLGGVPDGAGNKGLDTSEKYIGCMRVQNFGEKKLKIRKRKQLDLSQIESFGDVNKMECPVN